MTTATEVDLSWVTFTDEPVPCRAGRLVCEATAVWDTLWRSWDGEERAFNLCDRCVTRYTSIQVAWEGRIIKLVRKTKIGD